MDKCGPAHDPSSFNARNYRKHPVIVLLGAIFEPVLQKHFVIPLRHYHTAAD